jgi:hypothetical protein
MALFSCAMMAREYECFALCMPTLHAVVEAFSFPRHSRQNFIGLFHSREKWFLETLGKAEREGKKFVVPEWRFLAAHVPQFPIPVIRDPRPDRFRSCD